MDRRTAASLGLSDRSTRRWNEYSSLPSKSQSLALHLAKFEHRGAAQLAWEQEQKEIAEALERQLKQDFQRIERDKMRENRLFKDRWEEDGKEKHRENMEKARKRREEEEKWSKRAEMEAKAERRRKLQEESFEARGGIEAFERNLERSNTANKDITDSKDESINEANIDTGHAAQNGGGPMEHINSLARSLPSQNAQLSQASQFLASVHARAAMNRQAAKDRERRRKKLLLEQAERSEDLERHKEHEKRHEKLSTQSIGERELMDQIDQIHAEKDILEENALQASIQAREERERRWAEALERDRAMYEQEQAAYELQMKQQLEEFQRIKQDREAKQHQANEEYCREVVERMMELTMKCVTHRELAVHTATATTNASVNGVDSAAAVEQAKLIDPVVWREWMHLFVTGRPMLNPNAVDSEEMFQPNKDKENGNGNENGDNGLAPLDSSAAPVSTTAAASASGSSNGKKASKTPEALSIVEEIRQYADVQDVNRAIQRTIRRHLSDASPEAAEFLDDRAFEEYLTGQGEWNEEILTKRPAPEISVEFPDLSASKEPSKKASSSRGQSRSDPKRGGKDKDKDSILSPGGNAGGSMAAQMAPSPHTLFPVPENPVTNEFFGLLLQRLVAVASGTENPPDLPEVPRFPVGLILLGKPFSGKHTQAKMLKDKFNLAVFDPKELVEAALAFEAAQPLKSPSKAPKSALQTIGAKIKKHLSSSKSAEPIPDDLMVGLIVDAIRRLEEEQKNAPPHDPESEDPPAVASGWVLIDFPRTAQQAQLLEKELSGYEPPKPVKVGPPKVTKNRAEKVSSRVARAATSPAAGNAKDSALLLSPTADSAPPSPRPVSFIDAVIRLDISNELAIRRALGRRIDPETGTQYHIDFAPPDMNTIMKERLQKLPEHDKLESQLPLECANYSEHTVALQEWYQRFGNFHIIHGESELQGSGSGSGAGAGDKDMNTNTNTVSLVKEKVAIREEIREFVRRAIQKKQEKMEEKEQLEAAAGGSSAVGSVEKSPKVAPAASPKVESSAAASAHPAALSTSDAESGSASGAPVVEADSSSSPSFPPPSADQLTEFLGFYDADLAQSFVETWSTLETQYTQTIKQALRCLRQQRWSILEYFSTVRSNFLRYLQRSDYSSKQVLLDQFQSSFNSIPFDWRSDIATKEELSYRVDELCDQLFTIVQSRKQEAQIELSTIQQYFQSFFYDCHMTIYIHYYFTIVQAELDRYSATIRIVRDYFSVLKGGALMEETIPKTVQLPFPSVNFSALGLNNGTGAGMASPAGSSKKEKTASNVQATVLGSLVSGSSKESKKDTKKATGKPGAAAAASPVAEQFEFTNPFSEVIELLPTILQHPEEVLEQVQAAIAAQQAAFTNSVQLGGSTDGGKRKESAGTGGAASPARKYRIYLEKRQRPQLDYLFDAQLSYCIQLENRTLLTRVRKVFHQALIRLYSMKSMFYTDLIPRLDSWIQLKLRGETMAIDQLGEWMKWQYIERERPIEQRLRLEGESIFIEKDCLLQIVPNKGKQSEFTEAVVQHDTESTTTDATAASDALDGHWDWEYRRWFTINQLKHLSQSLLNQSPNSIHHIISSERLYHSLNQLRDLQLSHSIPLDKWCLPYSWTQQFNQMKMKELVKLFSAPQEDFPSPTAPLRGEVDLKHFLTVLGVCSLAAAAGQSAASAVPSLDSLRQLMAFCTSADTNQSGSISWAAFQSAPLPFLSSAPSTNGSKNPYWSTGSTASAELDAAQMQIREFFFDLFAIPLGRDRTQWSLPYSTLIFYFAFSDDTHNGSEKVRHLLNEIPSSASLSASTQAFLDRTKPGTPHSARFRIPELDKFIA